MRLFASGFNAHKQVNESTYKDSLHFSETKIAGDDLKILFAGWSETTVLAGSTRLTTGPIIDAPLTSLLDCAPDAIPTLTSGFGDHNGLLGVLSSTGQLYLLNRDSNRLDLVRPCELDAEAPPLSHLTIATNNNVAIIFRSMSASVTHLTQYPSFEAFLDWYRDPAQPATYPPQHFIVGGKARQLVAGAVGFTLLMESGEVWTWGDARFERCLGRGVTKKVPAGKPGIIEELGGLRVVKVASCGWLSGAITEAGDGYLWGIAEPGAKDQIGQDMTGKEVVSKIKLPRGEDSEVKDIGVGAGHAIILDQMGNVWASGKNSNGQLGVGASSLDVRGAWQKVEGVQSQTISSLTCGDLTSYVLVGD